MSQSTMSYGQALNEARQMIIQQQYRIKADADKIKSQQQQIVDQSRSWSRSERKLTDQTAEIQRISEELQAAHQRITEITTAKEQAEAVIDRQGQRYDRVPGQRGRNGAENRRAHRRDCRHDHGAGPT